MGVREYYKQQIPSEIKYKVLKQENADLEYDTWLFNG
jgi:hypothetical protein